jgi:RNA polymerase sigma-70 factor (ECF subfamily)
MKTPEFLPTRQSLLRRIKDWEDQEGWTDFFDTYSRFIYSVAIKAGLCDVEAQEVVQETVVTVARKIKGFEPDPQRGSFKSWLLHITRWRIADQVRKRSRNGHLFHRGNEDTARTATVEKVPDPAGLSLEASWDAEWEQHLTETALAKIKKRVQLKHYQMFHLHVLKQWPARKVAEKLGVPAQEVYFARRKVLALLQKEIQLLKAKIP